MANEEKYLYRGVFLGIRDEWIEKVKPLINFVLDNGGQVDQVKEKFGSLRFYYSQPISSNEDIGWDAFQDVVAQVENECTGDWEKHFNL